MRGTTEKERDGDALCVVYWNASSYRYQRAKRSHTVKDATGEAGVGEPRVQANQERRRGVLGSAPARQVGRSRVRAKGHVINCVRHEVNGKIISRFARSRDSTGRPEKRDAISTARR